MKQNYTLITGASSGIGLELANIAARDGRNLVLVARSKNKPTGLARDLAERHKVKTEVIVLDLSKQDSVQSLHKTLVQKNIAIDTLINNAGFGDYGTFSDTSLETQLSMTDLNMRALTELTHILPPSLLKTGGRIMNVASVAGFLPGPQMSVYFATKAYVLSFSEALAEELKDSGVTVTCLAPGSTQTDFGVNANTTANHSTQTSKVSAANVATYGWNAMLQGKPLAIHGVRNRLAIFALRFLPRRAVTTLVHRMQR